MSGSELTPSPAPSLPPAPASSSDVALASPHTFIVENQELERMHEKVNQECQDLKVKLTSERKKVFELTQVLQRLHDRLSTSETFSTIALNEQDARITELTELVQEKDRRIDELAGQLRGLQSQVDDLNLSRDKSEADRQRLEAELHSLQEANQTLRVEVRSLKSSVRTLTSENRTINAKLAAMMEENRKAAARADRFELELFEIKSETADLRRGVARHADQISSVHRQVQSIGLLQQLEQKEGARELQEQLVSARQVIDDVSNYLAKKWLEEEQHVTDHLESDPQWYSHAMTHCETQLGSRGPFLLYIAQQLQIDSFQFPSLKKTICSKALHFNHPQRIREETARAALKAQSNGSPAAEVVFKFWVSNCRN